jgi:hypothetical protein
VTEIRHYIFVIIGCAPAMALSSAAPTGFAGRHEIFYMSIGLAATHEDQASISSRRRVGLRARMSCVRAFLAAIEHSDREEAGG